MAKKTALPFNLDNIVASSGLQGVLNKPLLVLSLEEFCARALVVETTAGTTTIKAFAEVSFEISGRSARVKIAQLMEKLGRCDVRDVLLLSEDVQFYPGWLPDLPKKRQRADQLSAMSKVEIAPYVEGSPDDYWVRALYAAADENDEEFLPAGEVRKRGALIFAVPKPVYTGMQGILKAYKKRLVAMGSHESLAWAICGKTVAESGTHLVAEWRRDEVMAALIVNGAPQRLQRESVEAGEDGLAVVRHLAVELAEDLSQIDEIVVGGAMVEQAEWEAVDAGAADIHIKRWQLSQELPKVTGLELPARFMSLVGAAIAFREPLLKRPLCDDAVPLSQSVKENVHAVPLLLLVLLILGIGAQYTNLQSKKERLEKNIASFTEQKEQLEKKVKKKKSLEAKRGSKRSEKSKISSNQALLTKTMPAMQALQVQLFGQIVMKTPADVQLQLLQQSSDETWHVEGKTRNIQSVQLFPVQLKGISYVNEVKIEKSEERLSESGSGKSERWYYFRLRLRSKGGQA